MKREIVCIMATRRQAAGALPGGSGRQEQIVLIDYPVGILERMMIRIAVVKKHATPGPLTKIRRRIERQGVPRPARISPADVERRDRVGQRKILMRFFIPADFEFLVDPFEWHLVKRWID